MSQCGPCKHQICNTRVNCVSCRRRESRILARRKRIQERLAALQQGEGAGACSWAAAGCKNDWNSMLKHSLLLHAQAARRARRRMKWARASNKLLRASAGCSASNTALTMMSRQCGLPATSESSSTAFRRSRRARWGDVALHAHAMQQPCHAGAQWKCCDVVLMHRTCVPSCLLRRSRARARMQRWPCAGQTCSRSRFHR